MAQLRTHQTFFDSFKTINVKEIIKYLQEKKSQRILPEIALKVTAFKLSFMCACARFIDISHNIYEKLDWCVQNCEIFENLM